MTIRDREKDLLQDEAKQAEQILISAGLDRQEMLPILQMIGRLSSELTLARQQLRDAEEDIAFAQVVSKRMRRTVQEMRQELINRTIPTSRR